MLLGVIVPDGAGAKAMLEAGADLVIVASAGAAAAADVIGPLATEKACVGARLPSLDDAGAETLRKAGCDFVVSSLDSTASTAVNTERMGHVVAITDGVEDTTLRALAPLSLDGLFLDREVGNLSLADQLDLVRLSTFAATSMLVTVATTASVGVLRVLRDSGVAVAVAPLGTTPAQVAVLIQTLKAVPPPKKARREGGEMAIVPAVASASAGAEEEEEEEEDRDH